MAQLGWDDFAGGASFAPTGSERQVSSATGFVLEKDGRLRTAPARVSLGSPSGGSGLIGSLRVIELDENAWLFASVGTTLYRRLVSGTNWVAVSELSNPGAAVCRVRVKVANEYLPGVLTASGGITYRTTGGTWAGWTPTSRYPSLSGENPASGVLPHFGCATMWADFLVLGNIKWSAQHAATGLTAGNVKDYGNYLWVSDPLDQSKFDPRYPVRAAEEGEVIRALYPTEEGLYVVTDSSVNLLRGQPGDFVSDSPTGSLEPVGSGLQINASCWWPETQSIVLMTSGNRIYQVRTGNLIEIGPPVLLDTGLQTRGVSRTVAAAGGMLVLAFGVLRGRDWAPGSYGGGGSGVQDGGTVVLAMRAFNGATEGAWTTCATEDPTATEGALNWAHAVGYGNVVYFTRNDVDTNGDPVGDATVWSIDFDGDERYDRAVLRTVEAGGSSPDREKLWERAHVRLRVLSQEAAPATLHTVSLVGETADGDEARVDFEVEETTTGRVLRVTVPGLGPSVSCAVELDVSGDVVVESVRLDYERGVESW